LQQHCGLKDTRLGLAKQRDMYVHKYKNPLSLGLYLDVLKTLRSQKKREGYSFNTVER
jgi:hypothetical protein